MDKDNKIIMVTKSHNIFRDDYKDTLILGDHFNGFKPHKDIQDYERRILSNYGFMTRKYAEEDHSFKQPIRYVLIVNPLLKKVFSYQRSSGDERLIGKWSWGLGGHIELVDMNINSNNPIHESMLRELKEEVDLDTINPKILGYINHDNAKEVDRVHFGILYLAETNKIEIKANSNEIINGRFRNIGELEAMCSDPSYDVETWSIIALQPLKEYLNSL